VFFLSFFVQSFVQFSFQSTVLVALGSREERFTSRKKLGCEKGRRRLNLDLRFSKLWGALEHVDRAVLFDAGLVGSSGWKFGDDFGRFHGSSSEVFIL